RLSCSAAPPCPCVGLTSWPFSRRLHSTLLNRSVVPLSNQTANLRHVYAGIAVSSCPSRGSHVLRFGGKGTRIKTRRLRHSSAQCLSDSDEAQSGPWARNRRRSWAGRSRCPWRSAAVTACDDSGE